VMVGHRPRQPVARRGWDVEGKADIMVLLLE
jgi:hypothetical protein